MSGARREEDAEARGHVTVSPRASCTGTALVAAGLLTQRPHRAAAVRSLALNIRKATSVVQPFKKAFAKLTNLYDLALVSDTVELFEALLVTPPHLRILRVGGRNYPACFHDILTAHSRIDDLSIEFVCNISSAKGSKTQRTRLLSDGALLPSIKTLSLSAGTFSPTLVRYSYPITSLELLKPSHEDTTYALRLFSQTLVSFSILKLITSDCPSRCFWPTWALHCVRLPKLRILEMHHQWGSDLQLDGGEFDYPDVDAMEVPGLGKSCPELETIIWAVEHGVPENLYEDWSEGDAPIQHYVRTLVDALPSFARLAVFDPEEATTTSDGLFYGDIWTRDNMDSDEPENDVIDAPRWKKEACAAAGSRRKSERVGNRRLRHA
ncbi:hypothetical protein PYCCODRAFT_1481476 [Trametes coccinea BRFM310]|uniref:F-box domain-containing protein n=1 Tax=Trametes coccinea (strain BRFM310) TaxID=1353009 RepID=A0A1Y2I7N5_TRAC3|nr:hypothetical protein PYCCODRAFT_1481476 [Trametes coccinea BRFM310]